MIDPRDRQAITRATELYWKEQVSNPRFIQMAAGKEIGHRIADYVDDSTSTHLRTHFHADFERSANGTITRRSMGDIWIHSNSMWNPVNIKAGEMGKNGQPNIVSLDKLLDRLTRHVIDSYDLLIVKFAIANNQPMVPYVYFVDVLDYLDFVSYDAGPGQMMLREKDFYAAVDSGYTPPALSIDAKVSRLGDLLADGYERLLRNRQKRMEKNREKISQFTHEAHTIDQEGLSIGDPQAGAR